MSTALPQAHPLWQVQITGRFAQGEQAFKLEVDFVSTAPRLALIGPSGSGKTLTLKMIAGILKPDAGRIAVGGRTLLDSAERLNLPPRDRRLACVLQDYALFPHLTVRQNVAFAAQRGLRNPSTEPRHEDAEHWLERLGLAPLARHLPHQISGGQRQRTALARALVSRPSALLLDEPFAALDRPLRERLREELLALQTSLNLPLLLITHDEADVEHLAQDVLHMGGGRLHRPWPR